MMFHCFIIHMMPRISAGFKDYDWGTFSFTLCIDVMQSAVEKVKFH